MTRPRFASAGRRALIGLTVLWVGCGAPERVELVGAIERTQVELLAPVSEVIVGIHVARGERVEADQLVVELDPTLLTSELRRAEAALASAEVADRVSEHELQRTRELHAGGVASEQALEHVGLERKEAAALLLQARAATEAAEKRVRDLALRAPGAAIVDQLPFEVGERVVPGAILAVLLRTGRPWIRVWLPEPYLARVHPGMEVEVSIDGWPGLHSGRVLDIAREPSFTPHYALTERERANLVYETRIEVVSDAQDLRPGVPATVRLPFLDAAGAHANPPRDPDR